MAKEMVKANEEKLREAVRLLKDKSDPTNADKALALLEGMLAETP